MTNDEVTVAADYNGDDQKDDLIQIDRVKFNRWVLTYKIYFTGIINRII
jgi:hypothetical protein